VTKKEKVTVEWCINQLMADDGDFTSAIGKLCEMIGSEYPLYTLYQNNGIQSVSVADSSKKKSVFRIEKKR